LPIALDQAAAISRHDYLPFGEELFAGNGGRGTGQGYTEADTVRQKFTLKERDNETRLDYFLARYYSNTQGRFTSVDPFNPILEFRSSSGDDEEQEEAEAKFSEYLGQPQNWNRYSYTLNNPLAYVDLDGEVPVLIPVALVIIRLAPAAIAAGRYLASPQGQRMLQQTQRYGIQLGNFTLTRGRHIATEVFRLGPVVRGRVIEGLRGAPDAFTKNFKAIDNFSNYVATSIKSIDVFAKSYSQNLSNLSSTITRAVDQLVNFKGGNLPNGFIRANQIQGRVLEIVIPKGNLSNAQQQVLLRQQQEAAKRGVEIIYYMAN